MKDKAVLQRIRRGNGVQIVYGPIVSVIRSKLDDYLTEKIQAKTKVAKLYAPADGKIIPLKDVDDEVFSQGILGDGIAIIPQGNHIYSPCDGVVSSVVDSKHAIGIRSDNGFELLIHVGIDTVNLKGEHYKYSVNNGQKVKAGDLLLNFNSTKIKHAGYSLTTPIVITESDAAKTIIPSNNSNAKRGDVILQIEYQNI